MKIAVVLVVTVDIEVNMRFKNTHVFEAGLPIIIPSIYISKSGMNKPPEKLTVEVNMRFKKSTKNTHVFEAVETGLPIIIPSIYISKSGMNKPPEKLTVKVFENG